MFWYLLYSVLDDIINGRKKQGITKNPIKRLAPYITADVRSRYYKVIEFKNIDKCKVEIIELLCLTATKQYVLRKEEYPFNECRYGVTKEELWEICKKIIVEFCTKENITYVEYTEEEINKIEIEVKKRAGQKIKRKIKRILSNLGNYKEIIETLNEDLKKLEESNPEEPNPEEPKHEESKFIENKLEEEKTEIESKELIALRGYQVEAYEELNSKLEVCDNVLLHILCRCGKTELFKKYAMDNRESFDVIVYCAPRLNLIDSMIKRWKPVEQYANFYEISSNSKSEADKSFDNLKLDLFNEIRVMVFACNNSFVNLQEVLENNKDKRYLFVFDESHYLNKTADVNHPLVILNKLQLPYKKIIYSTATPKFGNPFIKNNKVLTNDEKYFGKLETVQFNDISKAIQQKFVVPSRIVIGKYKNIYENKEVKNQDLDCSSLTKIVISEISECMGILDSIMKDDSVLIKPRKILAFVSSTDIIEECYKYITSTYKKQYDVYKLHSGMNESDRRKTLDSFTKTKKLSILINCKMVTDGIDISDLDTVIFVNPKNSEADVTQILMRPRSYCISKPDKIATIILPIFDFAGTKLKFNTVIKVLKQLHNKNDPGVRVLADYCSEGSKKRSKTKTIKNNMLKKLEENDIYIDTNIAHDVFDEAQLVLCPRHQTMSEVILDILSDGIPRTVREIFNISEEKKMYAGNGKTPNNTFNRCCGELFSKFLLKHVKNSEGTIMYYIKKEIRKIISTEEFIKMLKDTSINSEHDYRTAYNGQYDDIYVVNPRDEYKDFEWSMLDQEKKYYDSVECKRVIDDLE